MTFVIIPEWISEYISCIWMHHGIPVVAHAHDTVIIFLVVG